MPVSNQERQRRFRARQKVAGFKRVTVALPKQIVEAIDAEAQQRGISRDQVISDRLSLPVTAPGELNNPKAFREACELLLALLQGAQWRTRKAKFGKVASIERKALRDIARALWRVVPHSSSWDELHEQLGRAWGSAHETKKISFRRPNP